MKGVNVMTTKTFMTNGKVLAIFAQGFIKGRKARYILYYSVATNSLIEKKKVSMKDGNSAFEKLLALGYRKVKVEVA